MKPRPLSTDWSGLPGSGVPNVNTRTSTHVAQIAIAGTA